MADEDNAVEKGDATKPPRRARPPVTIDLEARAVSEPSAPVPPPSEPPPSAPAAEAMPPPEEPAKPATAAPSPARSQRPQGGNWVGLFAAGFIGGLLVLLVGYGLLASGFGANGQANETALARIKGLEDGLDAASKRLAVVEARPLAPADPASRLDAVDGKLGDLESGLAAAGQRLDQAETAIAAIPPPGPVLPQNLAATSRVLDELMQRVDALEGAGTGADSGDMPAILGDRITALETSTAVLSGRLDALADQMQTLASRPDTTAGSEKAARAVAIGMLRQAAGRGGSFTAELAMVEALVNDPADLDELRPLAARGTPSVATLASDFPAVGDAILAASLAGEKGGIVERLIAHARGLVTVRPISPVAGDDPAAIVSRMRAAVDKGDLAAALKERDGLPAPEKTASADWAAAAGDRVAIDRLVDKLAAALGAAAKAD